MAHGHGMSSALGPPLHKAIANTSITPITAQTIALPRSPASQNPLAALKQRIALVHPLTNAPGLLNILRIFIGLSYRIIESLPLTCPPPGGPMEGETKERWFQLAQLAAVEQDPEKLIVLVQEINRLLDEKEARLNQRRSGAGPIHPYKPR